VLAALCACWVFDSRLLCTTAGSKTNAAKEDTRKKSATEADKKSGMRQQQAKNSTEDDLDAMLADLKRKVGRSK